tara:strand:+ start:1 stop:1395 length:1395 start_codon:yes stop_codon:yes gene_type:complete
MGAAGLGQSVTRYLVTALGGKNSDFTASRGGGTNKRPGTYDSAAATEFIKSKLNISEAGAVSEVQDSEEVVVRQEDVGRDDVPVNNFATNFPELVGLPANQVRNIVNGYIQDGTLAERGNFSAEQVTNVRNFLEQKNINNAEDLKDAVTRGEIRSPYVTALSITLALAGPDGKLAGGRTIADETKRLENFITTGISTATAQDLTTSMQTQQARDTASSNAFLNRVKEQNRINEALKTEFIEFTADFEEKGQDARKYFAQLKLPPEDRDKDFDSTLRSAYANWESGFEDTIRQITNSYGGIRDEGFLELWRQTERGKAGIAPTPRDMIRVLIEANAFPSDQATANIRDAMNLRVDIAAEAVFNRLRGVEIPLIDGSISEWLADFPRRDEGDTGSLAQLFKDRLVVVTDASGKITKIAGKARSGGIAFQAEEDEFIKALTAGGIPLDQLSILIEEVSVEGDREIRN